MIALGKSIIVDVKTGIFPQSAYNARNVFGLLKGKCFTKIAYNWDDHNPDEITWTHFLEVQLARLLARNLIPWPKVIHCQTKVYPKNKEVRIAISVPKQFVVGILKWR